MTCDVCGRRFDYCFYVNDVHWFAAVGRREGHWCAHCVLQELGGLYWYVVENEPLTKIRTNDG